MSELHITPTIPAAALAMLLLAACDRKVVERTPDALARRVHAASPAVHDVVVSPSELAAAVPNATGVGRIVAVDRAKGLLTLEHDPATPDDWPRARLVLPAHPTTLLQSAAIGDRVEFHVEARRGVDEVVALRPARTTKRRPDDRQP